MVVTTWSNCKMHIPILLFDDKHFERKIRFPAIFWNFNFFNNFGIFKLSVVFLKTNFKMSVIYGLPITQIWIKIGYSKDSNRHPSTPYCRGGCFLLCFLLKHSPYIQSPVHGISNTQQVQGFLCLTWQPQLLRGGSLQEMMSLQEMISYCSP